MRFGVTKTGLDFFDTARVWGLAGLLGVAVQSDVRVRDMGWRYIVECGSPPISPGAAALMGLMPPQGDASWVSVFVTSKQNDRIDKYQKIQLLLGELLQNPTRIGEIFPADRDEDILSEKGETLPGPLEPAAFKGVRQRTRARYAEDQLRVDGYHWAVACLGMALCGVYRQIDNRRRTLVVLAVPSDVRLYNPAEIQALARPNVQGAYISGATMAAHAAVKLAESLRQRAAAQGGQLDRFSEISFFELFRAGNQTKPAQGSRVRLDRLLKIVQVSPHRAENVFEWLDYCFRRGSVRGYEELALAVTEFVTYWDLSSYERLARVFLRLLATEKIKLANSPSAEVVEEVVRYVENDHTG